MVSIALRVKSQVHNITYCIILHAHTICLQCITENNSDNPATVGGTRTLTTPTTAVCRGTPTTVVVSQRTPTPAVVSSETPTTSTTPQENTDKSVPTPSGPQGSSTDDANLPSDGKYVCSVRDVQ